MNSSDQSGIPPIVRLALGQLRGHLLPNYLSLRGIPFEIKNDHDVHEVNHEHMARIIVAPYIPRTAANKHVTVDRSIHQSLGSLVDGAIRTLVLRTSTCNNGNVLSMGYLPASPASPSCPNLPDIRCLHPNPIVDRLRSCPVMKMIHVMAGDDEMREMLVNAIVLVPVDNGNYLQVAGLPLNILVKGDTYKRVQKRKGDPIDNTKRDFKRHRWNPNESIPRSQLLYANTFTTVGLPAHHPLHTSNTNALTALLDAMVHLRTRRVRKSRWKRLRDRGLSMCEDMRKRHKQCDYPRELERTCPLQPIADAELSRVVMLFTPVVKVGLFVERVLRRSFPGSFWGSERNFQKVVGTMKEFLQLGRGESLPMKTIMKGLSVLDVRWLHPPTQTRLSKSGHESTTHLLGSVMKWVYCNYIIPILRSAFYITDTEFTGSKTVYYRKPVWACLRSLSMNLLLTRQYRERTTLTAARVLSTHNEGIPPAPLRLLPKKTGVRAIAMLSRSGSVGTARHATKPAPNRLLQSAFHALHYECTKRPSLFGAGVPGVSRVFSPYCAFLKALRKRPRPLYFTGVDIRHCYDSIHQQHLFGRIRSVLREDSYITRHHFVLHPKDGGAAVQSKWRRTTSSPAGFSGDLSSETFKYRRSIFVQGGNYSVDKQQRIVGLLRDHIFGQIVVDSGSRGRPLLQKNGIPQGSVLSSLFCNIYFGSIEAKLFDGVFDDESTVITGSSVDRDGNGCIIEGPGALHLVVRVVDDFLLISTDRDTSIRFLNRLNKGIPRLGLQVNHDKTRVSYNTTSDDANRNVPAMFPWCGLLIDTTTCEIRLDQTRFSGSQATDTVTAHRSGNEGVALIKKMKDFCKPRCHQPLLFSELVNGPDTLRVNFYHTLLLCALKTMHYLKTWDERRILSNPDFIHGAVSDTIHYAYSVISIRGKLGLTRREALWLGRHAFRSAAKRETGELRQMVGVFSERKLPVRNRSEMVDVSKRALELWQFEGAGGKL